MRDVDKLTEYLLVANKQKNPGDLVVQDLQLFIKWIGELGMTATSQARIISGIRSFYKYCLIEQIVI
ncbi:site-specific integrase, partial [Escherichia coli]